MKCRVVSWTGSFKQPYPPSYHRWNENEQGPEQSSALCLQYPSPAKEAEEERLVEM